MKNKIKTREAAVHKTTTVPTVIIKTKRVVDLTIDIRNLFHQTVINKITTQIKRRRIIQMTATATPK